MSMVIDPYRFGVAAWTPASLPNLKLWYDASDAGSFTYSSGSAVSQWNDLSGNADHLAQADTSLQPARNTTIGTLDAVQFDGTGDRMDLAAASFSQAQPFTALAVWYKMGTGSQVLFDAAPGQSACGFYDNTMEAGGSVSYSSGFANNTTHTAALIFDGASSKMYANGGAAVGTGNVGSNSLNGLRVGLNRVTGSAYFNGKLGELVICSGVLGLSDLNAFGEYGERWGHTWTTAT